MYHLWEFIRDLLHDDRYCPRIIKWESEDEGIFRVVKSDEVAKHWGSKKNNRSKMTYEKLSRSLRWAFFPNVLRKDNYKITSFLKYTLDLLFFYFKTMQRIKLKNIFFKSFINTVSYNCIKSINNNV